MTYHDEVKALHEVQLKTLQVSLEVHDNPSMGAEPKSCVDCGTIMKDWPVDVPAICDSCLEERRWMF